MAGAAAPTEAGSVERVRLHCTLYAALASIKRRLIKQRECLYFSTPIRLSATKYSSPVVKTESIPNLNSVMENLIVNQAKRSLNFGDVAMKSNQSHISGVSVLKGGNASSGHQAVARKSTTRSIVSNARPGPRVFKAVARKSTNPLPRYPSSAFMSYQSISRSIKTKLEVGETESEPSSHYGIPSSPINLAELNTYMVVGGHNMRLTCLTLSTLININPKILLKDIRKDPRYATILSNSD